MTNKPDNEIFLPFELQRFRGEYRNYLAAKRTNYLVTIESFPVLWDCYQALDEIWVRGFSDLERITESGQMLPLKLFTNAHAQFRVAFELAFATCLGEAWNIVRSSIETAVQAHKIRREPALALVWSRKGRGKKENEAYREAFERNKKDSLFPAEHGLRELHQYYGDYSELGTHPTISALALRHADVSDDKDLRWRHEYLETRADRIAPFLLVMLNACGLVERAFFDSFSRLGLDVELGTMRQRFTVSRRQAADWIIRTFNISAPAISLLK
jgi:hypothetical protein